MAAFRGMHVSECMCRLRNIANRDYQESVTTGQTERQTPNKVIPMCCYASQATKKVYTTPTNLYIKILWREGYLMPRFQSDPNVIYIIATNKSQDGKNLLL